MFHNWTNGGGRVFPSVLVFPCFCLFFTCEWGCCFFLSVICWSMFPVPPLKQHKIIPSLLLLSLCGTGCVCSTTCPFVYLFIQFFHHKLCVYLGCGYSLTAKPCGKVCVYVGQCLGLWPVTWPVLWALIGHVIQLKDFKSHEQLVRYCSTSF